VVVYVCTTYSTCGRFDQITDREAVATAVCLWHGQSHRYFWTTYECVAHHFWFVSCFYNTLSLTIAIVAFLSVLNTGSISGLWSKLIIIPVVVAVWSISTIAVIAFQANKISGGDPFCLAAHKTNGEITNFAQLRGLSFYAPLRGKNALQWDFHGLLIVGADEGPAVYNWSPRWARFDVIAQPALFLVDPLTACVPKAD